GASVANARPECCRTRPGAKERDPNQSHGGIYMVGRLEAGSDDRGEGVGLSLEGSSAATLDRVRPLGEVAEESVDVGLDLGFGAETGVGGHLLAAPAPAGFIWVEGRAVGGQPNQAETQVRRGQGGASS